MSAFQIEYKEDDIHIYFEPLKPGFQNYLEIPSEWPSLQPRLSQRIVLHLEKVNSLSEIALNEMSNWLKKFDQRIHFVFESCGFKIISALNRGTLYRPPELVVQSFYWPYECSHCGHHDSLWLVRGKDYIEADALFDRQNSGEGSGAANKPRFLGASVINCSRCHEGMEVSVLEQQYLQFLQQRKIPSGSV